MWGEAVSTDNPSQLSPHTSFTHVCSERRRGGEEETEAREKQSRCGSVSKQEEGEDGLSTEGEIPGS